MVRRLSTLAALAAVFVIAPVLAIAQDGGLRFDWEIGFGNVVTLLVMLAGGVYTYFDIRARSIANTAAIVDARETAEKAIAQVRAWAAEEIKEAKDEAAEAKIRAEAANMALNEFRIEVAREYASKELIREITSNITTELHRLGDRIDSWLERASRVDGH